jgi:hypothetical protein
LRKAPALGQSSTSTARLNASHVCLSAAGAQHVRAATAAAADAGHLAEILSVGVAGDPVAARQRLLDAVHDLRGLCRCASATSKSSIPATCSTMLSPVSSQISTRKAKCVLVWGENRPPKGKGGPRLGSVDKGWCCHERDSMTANHLEHEIGTFPGSPGAGGLESPVGHPSRIAG